VSYKWLDSNNTTDGGPLLFTLKQSPMSDLDALYELHTQSRDGPQMLAIVQDDNNAKYQRVTLVTNPKDFHDSTQSPVWYQEWRVIRPDTQVGSSTALTLATELKGEWATRSQDREGQIWLVNDAVPMPEVAIPLNFPLGLKLVQV